jgi:hypothetical protein
VAYFDQRMVELQSTLASKADILALKDLIHKQQDEINGLKEKITCLQSQVDYLLDHSDESEQYSRRLCLRIDGIPVPENGAEKEEDVITAVKKVITEAGVTIPADSIDRAHRIGKGRVVAGKQTRQVIVKFANFRSRTSLYRARKAAHRYKIYLDLTRNRKKTMDDINRYLSENQSRNCYAFADINCRLTVKLSSGFHHVRSFEEFLRLFGDVNER